MTEAWSDLKPKGDCECGVPECTLFGTLGRPDKAGKRHVRGCAKNGCRVCLGKSSKRKGQRKQAAAARALGIPKSSLSPGHEEFFPGTVRVEIKSGAQVRAMHTAFLKMRAQSDASKAVGNARPFAAVAMPDGVSYGIVAVRTDELVDFVQAMAEQLGLVA